MIVKELMDHCKVLVDNGLGDKEIWISRDDEGNGYHQLFYTFTWDQKTIDEVDEVGLFDNPPEDKENIVLLG